MSATLEIEWFNSYIVRKVQSKNNAGFFTSPGVAYGTDTNTTSNTNTYFVEEARIRGGYNNTATDNGVRAYLDEQYPLQQKRINTLIYSGIYNSRTGVNNTNVFSIGDAITKSLDPSHGSIQKTYAEDTNLIVFQENKIHRALIEKDTIYTTESGTQTQAGKAVIGQFVPYKGEYGISKNPESFAIYNYRKYFADKNRNAIMRLSNDGLTEINMYGMQDYFRDSLSDVNSNFTNQVVKGTVNGFGQTSTTKVSILTSSITSGQNITAGMSIFENPGHIKYVAISGSNTIIYYSQLFSSNLSGEITFNYKTRGKLIGGWDIHNKNYVLSIQKTPNQVSTLESTYDTLAFDESINGWVSFFTFKPNFIFSVLNNFYSVQNSTLYKHYDDTSSSRGLFYGVRKPSNVTFIFNDQSSIVKNFQTAAYEGSNGWEVTSFVSGFTGFDPNPATGTSTYIQDQDKNYVDPSTLISIRSYDEGLYTDSVTGQPLRAGFNRKENRYVSNLISNSVARAGEIIFGNQISGIKGYFATVTIETDATTNLGGAKELWSAGTKYVVSSY
jgi:hypothetical protein